MYVSCVKVKKVVFNIKRDGSLANPRRSQL